MIPVKVISSSDLEENGGVYLVKKGVPAIPVHGFTTQGNKAVSSRAMPVYVVSQSEFDAGDFVKAHGQPFQVGDINDLGFMGVVGGREAMPVYAVNDWPTGAIIPFVGAYDAIPNLVHVYEPARRTLTSYTGPLVRIRRSSNNAEQDFGYVTNGDLDTAAIATFIGAGSGFVTSVYDQAGEDGPNNPVSSTQPIYVASGYSGKPVMRFSAHRLATTFVSAALIQPVSIYAVAILNTGAVNDGLSHYILSGVGAGSMILLKSATGTPDDWRINAGVSVLGGTADDTMNVWAALFNGVSSEFWINSVSKGIGNVGASTMTGIAIGRTSSNTNPWIGDIASVVIADPSHSTAERQAVQTAINNYWAVY